MQNRVVGESSGSACIWYLRIFSRISRCGNGMLEKSFESKKDPFDFVGFRAVGANCLGSGSFLEGIGREITKGAHFDAPKFVSTAPFATDGNLPTDPYKTASGERKKDLLLENFSSVVPGYTGKRRFID